MPQRAANLLLAICGAFIALGLLLVGADYYAASRRGPRWWKRLLGAGLFLLAAVGGGCARSTSDAQCDERTTRLLAQLDDPLLRLPAIRALAQMPHMSPATTALICRAIDNDLMTLALGAPEELSEAACSEDWGFHAAAGFSRDETVSALVDTKLRLLGKLDLPLEELYVWRRFVDLRHSLAEMGAGRRGSYPFDRPGGSRLQARVMLVLWDLTMLRGAELITSAERNLLIQDMSEAWEAVSCLRPAEVRLGTCYLGVGYEERDESPRHMRYRIDTITDLAETGGVRPEVLKRALIAAIRDASYLREGSWEYPGNRAKATELREIGEYAFEMLDGIEDQVPDLAVSLEDAADWVYIHDVLESATEYAGTRLLTSDQRECLIDALEEARERAVGLYLAGALTIADATIVLFEAEHLKYSVLFGYPFDTTHERVRADLAPFGGDESAAEIAEMIERSSRDAILYKLIWHVPAGLPRIRRAVESSTLSPPVMQLLRTRLARDIGLIGPAIRAYEVEHRDHLDTYAHEIGIWKKTLSDAEATLGLLDAALE